MYSSIRKLPFPVLSRKARTSFIVGYRFLKAKKKKKKKKKKEVAAALVTLVEARFIDHSKLKGIYGFRERNMPSCVCVCADDEKSLSRRLKSCTQQQQSSGGSSWSRKNNYKKRALVVVAATCNVSAARVINTGLAPVQCRLPLTSLSLRPSAHRLRKYSFLISSFWPFLPFSPFSRACTTHVYSGLFLRAFLRCSVAKTNWAMYSTHFSWSPLIFILFFWKITFYVACWYIFRYIFM